jgi:hypothetical protein
MTTGAEGMEGRPPTQGKAVQSPMPRTQSRMTGMSATLERPRLAVRRDKKGKLTSLYHHVYKVDLCWPKTSSVFMIIAKTCRIEAWDFDLSRDNDLSQYNMNMWLESRIAVKSYQRIVFSVPLETNSGRTGFSASTAGRLPHAS